MKTANKTTAVSVVKPQPLVKLQPPPRKEDVINAMLARAREKFQAEDALRKAERKNIEEELHALAFAQMKKDKTLKPANIHIDQWDACVDFKFEIKSPEIKGLVLKYKELGERRTFDEKETKRMIRESLDTTHERVAALLGNPEALKQIDRLLEEAAI